MAERKSMLFRLDPAVHDALARWADDLRRSTNASPSTCSAARWPRPAACLVVLPELGHGT